MTARGLHPRSCRWGCLLKLGCQTRQRACCIGCSGQFRARIEGGRGTKIRHSHNQANVKMSLLIKRRQLKDGGTRCGNRRT